MKYVYKITYPNKKIYIGVDLINEITYFGSVDPKAVARDFTWEDRKSFTVTKEILWSSDTASDKEAKAKELEMIRLYKSDDPKIGYNQWPRRRQV